ncbi:unnamed protein product [Meganyctiphanes norvegica]|uniref:small monomeric GTPase n=1 Tax=Meganyctiphanes norvegica TaxID=48144 RepID=A0AAV2S1T8_MEGNR
MWQTLSTVFSSFFGKEVKLFMSGLDAAGKTTILYKLKFGATITSIPTIGINVETFEHNNISFTVSETDVCARANLEILPQVRQQFQNTQGLIFVVDSIDRERIKESAEVLAKLLQEDDLQDALLLVFANKQDLPNALTVAEVIAKLAAGIGPKQLQKRKWHIEGTCALDGHFGQGLQEGLDWLSEELLKK